jgi:ribosomal protein S18 acetylase RimI-like enzyme
LFFVRRIASFIGMILRNATLQDVEPISALLTANGSDRGGALYGDWSVEVVRACINSGQLIIVAVDAAHLLGVLFTSETADASAPPVLAMLKAWPGGADAYVYGPVCIDQAARGRGVLEALYAELIRQRPGREAILFIKANNPASLRAHARLGMAQVADFTLEGEVFIVLSSRR